MGTNQLAPFSGHVRKITNSLCSEYPGNIVCETAVKLLGGYSDDLYDQVKHDKQFCSSKNKLRELRPIIPCSSLA